MTRKEYENLLQSDYWKGFSYSLIKERNFTCEDCGRRFYNQRNKLQVHHLVYRDINPWSYKPEEMVVLCEDCHKKRHGIYTEPTSEDSNSYSHDASEDYAKTYSFSNESGEEKSHSFSEADRWGNNGVNNASSRNQYPIESQRRFKWEYVLYGILLLFALSFGWNKLNQDESNESKEVIEISSKSVNNKRDHNERLIEPSKKAHVASKSQNNTKTKNEVSNRDLAIKHTEPKTQSKELAVPTVSETIEEPLNDNVPVEENVTPQRELSTIELLEKKNHEAVVERAKRAGVSTEGSTIDILERMQHADVVERAKRAGVSTEGSTIEILERINRKQLER